MSSEMILKENSKRLEFTPAPIITADNFEGLVREELGKIGEGFFRIGYYLSKARDDKLYISLGYDNLFEMSEDLFDLKESSVFNMMAVWKYFHSVKNPLTLREDCRGLKYSQLVECLRDKWDPRCGVTRVISSADTVRETKAKVTAWNVLTGKLSCYPSLEQVEREIECQQLRKEREEAERENSKRLESAPELKGQLPGQTSLFVEGYAEEPQEQDDEQEENSKRLEFSGEEPPTEEPAQLQTFGVVAENPFEGLPKETKIYADELVKSSREKSNEYGTTDIVPADVQMRVHKRSAISYIEVMSMAENAEGVEHFFNVAINRLVAMRAYKLLELKGKKE